MRIKIIFTKNLFLFFVLSFVLISVGYSSIGNAKKKAKFKIKMASVAPEGTPWTDYMRIIKKNVQKKSNKEIKIKLLLGGILGGEENHISALQKNKIQAVAITMVPFSKIIPEAFIMDMPYLMMNDKEVDYIQDKVVFKIYDKIFQKHGFKLAVLTENGWRSFGSTHNPIITAEDLASCKVSSYQNPYYIEMWKLFKSNPIPTAVTEVLASMQTGLVNVLENSPLFLVATSWHTALKHFSLTRHIYSSAVIVLNKKEYDSLPNNYQKLLISEITPLAPNCRNSIRKITPDLIAEIKNSGVNVVEVTESQREEFAKKSIPIRKKIAKTIGPSGTKLLSTIENKLKKFRKK